MRNMEWQNWDGKRVLINLDRIDAIIEISSNNNYTMIYVGGSEEPFTVRASYDDVLKHIPSE